MMTSSKKKSQVSKSGERPVSPESPMFISRSPARSEDFSRQSAVASQQSAVSRLVTHGRRHVSRVTLHWSIALAAVGALDAIYLTYIKLADARAALCAPGGGCDIVNASSYSEIAGIPIATLGFLAYIVILAFLLLESRWGIRSNEEYFRLAVFGLSLCGVLYSGYLTYLELFVLHAICPYCVLSALLLVALLALSVLRLRNPEYS